MTRADEGKLVWFKKMGRLFVGWVLIVRNKVKIWVGKKKFFDPAKIRTCIHVIPDYRLPAGSASK